MREASALLVFTVMGNSRASIGRTGSKYRPYAFSFMIIKSNSTINVALVRDSSSDPTTSANSVWSKSAVRIYVEGHMVNIVGIDSNTNVKMFNLSGKKLLDQRIYRSFEVADPGVYIVEIAGEEDVYKIVVK